MGCKLPPFAFWGPEELEHSVVEGECEEIARRGLGWMVTDYRSGEFITEGSVRFILRCGNYRRLGTGRGKLYAESLIILRDGQNVPGHFHPERTKDLMNRSGGRLCLRLYPCSGGLSDAAERVEVASDGQRRYLERDEKLVLLPGGSVTVAAGMGHELWAESGDVLVSEISIAGNMLADSTFIEAGEDVVPDIDEDETPRRLLICDYPGRFPDLTNG